MNKPVVVALEPFPAFVEEMLDRSFAMHRVWKSHEPDRAIEALAGEARGIAALGHTRIDDGLFRRLPALKIVSLMSVGYDGTDVAAARARGISVTNTPDVLTDDVADLAITLLVAAARRIVVGDRYVRNGRWRQGNMALATSVSGKTVGVLGLGRIGSAIARRAEAFQMNVVYGVRPARSAVPWRHYDDPVAMARDSDFLIVSVPGGDATRHLVDARVLDALGPDGIIVNVARGSVVDQAALVDALRSGRLGGAALDVFENEPDVPEELVALDHVVLQPHVGSATHRSRSMMAKLMIDNLLRQFAGESLLTPVY